MSHAYIVVITEIFRLLLSQDHVYNEGGAFDFTSMYWGHVAMKITRVDF